MSICSEFWKNINLSETSKKQLWVNSFKMKMKHLATISNHHFLGWIFWIPGIITLKPSQGTKSQGSAIGNLGLFAPCDVWQSWWNKLNGKCDRYIVKTYMLNNASFGHLLFLYICGINVDCKSAVTWQKSQEVVVFLCQGKSPPKKKWLNMFRWSNLSHPTIPY